MNCYAHAMNGPVSPPPREEASHAVPDQPPLPGPRRCPQRHLQRRLSRPRPRRAFEAADSDERPVPGPVGRPVHLPPAAQQPPGPPVSRLPVPGPGPAGSGMGAAASQVTQHTVEVPGGWLRVDGHPGVHLAWWRLCSHALNVLYSLQHLGYTIPPQADSGWIGEAGPGPSYLDAGSGGPDNDFTNRNTTFMTWNLLHLARMLKDAGGIPAHGNQRSEWDAGCRFDFDNPDYR